MMEKETVVFYVSICLMVVTLIGCISYYNYNQTQAIRANIEAALAKGIDPLSVRCAYSSSQDTVCIAYAARK